MRTKGFYLRFDLPPFTFKFHSNTVTRTACADFTKIVASDDVRVARVAKSITNEPRFSFSSGWTRGQSAAWSTDGTVSDVNALEKFTTMNELWTERDAHHHQQ